MTTTSTWFQKARHRRSGEVCRHVFQLMPLCIVIGIKANPLGLAVLIQSISAQGGEYTKKMTLLHLQRKPLLDGDVAAIIKLVRIPIPARDKGICIGLGKLRAKLFVWIAFGIYASILSWHPGMALPHKHIRQRKGENVFR
jgi:hypothetical protein